MNNNFMLSFSLFVSCLVLSFAQLQESSPANLTTITEPSTTVTEPSTTVTEPPTIVTTIVNNITCGSHDNDCKACVAYSECYYCETDNKCRKYKLLNEDECSMKDQHYLTCRLNFKWMMIGIGVLIVIAFLIITIFCCICCCRKKGIKISKDDLKWARQKEERKQIQMERRQERSERTEEIRKKYGLVKEKNPYQRFDA